MKRILAICFSLTLTFVTSVASGQQIPKTGLKVGEQLPDLSLGKVIDKNGNLSSNYLGKAKFSDFRGKLVILDFWTSYCVSCIEGFKKMTLLQEKYKDKIQIFLVNTYENDTQIKNWIQKNKTRGNTDIVPANLPIIADAKELSSLFPLHKEIGYHVWIDKKGTIKLRGIAENTHEKKIDALLSGKNISYVQDGPVYNPYNPNYPYFLSNSSQSGKLPLYSSNFGPLDDVHAPAGGAGADDFIDSASGTRRNTYLNHSILDLYQKALKPQLSKDTSVLYGNRILIDLKDLASVTQNEKILKRKATDEDYKSKLCYEQIVPIAVSDDIAKANMLDDLNKFLSQNFSLYGQWKERTVPCLKLKFIGDVDKIKSKNLKKGTENKYVNNQTEYSYTGFTAKSVLREHFTTLDAFNIIRTDCIIIDNTLWGDQLIDLKLPVPDEPKSQDEFIKIIRPYGFELLQDSVKTKVFVIEKVP